MHVYLGVCLSAILNLIDHPHLLIHTSINLQSINQIMNTDLVVVPVVNVYVMVKAEVLVMVHSGNAPALNWLGGGRVLS